MGLSWELNEIKRAWHTAGTQYTVIMLTHHYCWTFIIITTHCAAPSKSSCPSSLLSLPAALRWLHFQVVDGSLGIPYRRFPAGFPVGGQGEKIWSTEERANKHPWHRVSSNWWYINTQQVTLAIIGWGWDIRDYQGVWGRKEAIPLNLGVLGREADERRPGCP